MSTNQRKKKTTKKETTENVVEESSITTENVVESSITTENVVEESSLLTENSDVEETLYSSDKITQDTYTTETEILDANSILTEIKEQIKEEIKEKTDEIITIKVPKNLVDLVKEEIKQKTYILNKEYIDILNSLVNTSPLLLNDIEKAMFEITKDGKIDSNDIPYLITIIQKLYEFMFSLKIGKISTEKRAAICAEIIKFIVLVLIKERRIKVEPIKQDEFLIKFNALMDSCISLLSLQSVLLSKGCFSCLFSKK